MKKFLTIFALIAMLFCSVSVADAKPIKKRWFDNKDPRIEVVNEMAVIFHNVVKIEVKASSRSTNQVTYIYDLKHSKLVKAARGSFEVEVPQGNYLVLSNKKITRMDYEVVIE